MIFPTRHDNGQVFRILLVLTVGLGLTVVAPDVSSARQKKNTIYNVCGCACSDPTTGFGELLPDIQNTAGVPCEAYNNRACSLDGGTRTGTTKFCQGMPGGGTKAMLGVIPNTTFSVMSRGAEGEKQTSSGQGNEPVELLSKPGNVMMNCSCEGGSGSCSVTSTDGKTSTCHKGDGDSCTGSCAYPKGTISGEQ
jgi:hypothetical protein